MVARVPPFIFTIFLADDGRLFWLLKTMYTMKLNEFFVKNAIYIHLISLLMLRTTHTRCGLVHVNMESIFR